MKRTWKIIMEVINVNKRFTTFLIMIKHEKKKKKKKRKKTTYY